MTDEPLDFASLDPAADQLRHERLLRAIALRAQPALIERARLHHDARDTVARQLVRWQPRLIAASVALALPAIGATAWRANATDVEWPQVVTSTSQIATAIGVPADLLSYVESAEATR